MAAPYIDNVRKPDYQFSSSKKNAFLIHMEKESSYKIVTLKLFKHIYAYKLKGHSVLAVHNSECYTAKNWVSCRIILTLKCLTNLYSSNQIPIPINMMLSFSHIEPYRKI